MKRLVCVMILFSLICTTTVFAEGADLPGRNDDNQAVVDVEYVGNGNYIETVIFDDEFADYSLVKGITPLASKTVTKSKAYNYKNAAGKELWYVKVTGTFTYGNGSAKCTAATPSAKSNEKIVAVTASMKDGTGLTQFSQEFPYRFSNFVLNICCNGFFVVTAFYINRHRNCKIFRFCAFNCCICAD